MNWLAIIIAAVANMVIGTLWYGTWAFGKSWMTLSGHTMGGGMQSGPLDHRFLRRSWLRRHDDVR